MSGVFETDVECPVCHGNFAHTDFETRTNEREFDCERCGYSYQTKLVERGRLSFWQVIEQMPLSRDGRKAAQPYRDGENPEAVPGGESLKWNAVEWRTLPSFTDFGKGVVEEFGIEEAK